jgi:5-methylcytosine-specific restriction endonuclease McrA
LECFGKSTRAPDGLRGECRPCRKELAVEYRLKYPERVRAMSKRWREANVEKFREIRRIWRESNRPYQNWLVSEWQKKNRDMKNAAVRNRRARMRNSGGTHNARDIKFLLSAQKSRCAACKVDISEKYEVDHIIPTVADGRNDRYNLQLLCVHCNRTKSDKDPISFMNSLGKLL